MHPHFDLREIFRRERRRAREIVYLGASPVLHPHLIDHRAKAFVDFQNDVTVRDLALATREGMRSIEHVKRYTTTGMATDQGKTSNMNALAIASASAWQDDPRGRPHHVPPALYAGDIRRFRPYVAARAL